MLTGKHVKLLTAAGALAVAFATSSASADKYDDLLRMYNELKAQVDQVQKQAQTAIIEAKAAADEAKAAAKTASGPKWKWGPSPTIKSQDGKFEVHVRGRVMVDFGYVSDDIGREDSTATEMRRGRLGIEGKAWKNIKYKFEVDFGDDEVDVTDAYVQYRGIKNVKLTFGQFKTPNSLEEQTSSRHIAQMERASFTDAFGLNRRLGVGVNFSAGDFGFDAGVFGQNLGVTEDNNEGYAFAARGYWQPSIGNGGKVHIGASIRLRDLGNDADEGELRYRQRSPGAHVQDNRIVDTGTLTGLEDDVFYGVELAGTFGPFFAEAEWAWLEVNFDSAGALAYSTDSVTFQGGYFGVGWLITGEHRKLDGGDWGRIKPKNPIFEGGMGAWLLTARVDYIDLNDGEFTGGSSQAMDPAVISHGVFGGEQLSFIVGLNWYLNNHTAIKFVYAHSEIEDAFFNSGDVDDAYENSLDAFTVRFQVDW